MFTFDASAILYAWDNYPIENFPPLWHWIGEQIASSQFSIPLVAYEEAENKSPECGEWLGGKAIKKLPLSNNVLQRALSIKNLLKIVNDKYHPKGVSENDLFIIATAQLEALILISEEGQQFHRPNILSKCRIPAVCAMSEVNVSCMRFIDLIRCSGAVFD